MIKEGLRNDFIKPYMRLKKGKEGDLSADNYVNGITGATLTSDGVNNMIQKCLNDYQDILESLKK